MWAAVPTASPAPPAVVPRACSPAGTFSGEGAAQCQPCPAGQYNPLDGLPDQTSIPGIPCIACAVGSMALRAGETASTEADELDGAVLCDAW